MDNTVNYSHFIDLLHQKETNDVESHQTEGISEETIGYEITTQEMGLTNVELGSEDQHFSTLSNMDFRQLE